ncbi:hypothetical protein BJ741DRAFT_648 [Chytriomyces cf. hyalinus JEL632]|nr:hypothetical protein BJ741DRAFT_648 [Chytriomyces cf. hyalinus JEL632]
MSNQSRKIKRNREAEVDPCSPASKKLRVWPPVKPFGRPLSDHATERDSLSKKRPYLGTWVNEDTMDSKRRLLNSGQTSVVAPPTQHKLQNRTHPWPEYFSQRTPASRAIAQPASSNRGTSPYTPPVESSTPARLTAAQCSAPTPPASMREQRQMTRGPRLMMRERRQTMTLPRPMMRSRNMMTQRMRRLRMRWMRWLKSFFQNLHRSKVAALMVGTCTSGLRILADKKACHRLRTRWSIRAQTCRPNTSKHANGVAG